MNLDFQHQRKQWESNLMMSRKEKLRRTRFFILFVMVCLEYTCLIYLAGMLNDRHLYQVPHALQTILLVVVTLFCYASFVFSRKFFNPRANIVAMILLTAFGTFLFYAKGTLFNDTSMFLEAAQLPLFVMLLIPLYFTLFSTMAFLTGVRPFIVSERKRNIQKREHTLVLAIFQLLILSFYVIAFAPGNMSFDTHNQFSQITGQLPYMNWHPIAHTLYLQAVYAIFQNFSVFCVLHILFYVAVSTAFAHQLMMRGMKPVVLYVVLLLMALLPNVGINLMTLWKDIIFSIGLLWMTLIIYKMRQEDYFSNRRNALAFVICTSIVGLFRFNGVLAFIFMLVYALVHVAQRDDASKRAAGVSISIILLLFVSFTSIIPNYLEAEENPPGMKLRPVFQGLGAMVVADETHAFDDKTRSMMMAIAAPEEWTAYYDPYFSDIYVHYIPGFVNKLSEINTGTALASYLRAFSEAPGVIAGDRLNLSILSWSAVADPFSYDNRYTLKLTPLMTRDYGVSRENGVLFLFIEKISEATTNLVLADTLLWRVGIYLVVLMVALAVHLKSWPLYMPLFANWVVVFFTMPAQDYRYVWFVFIMAPFVVLASITERKIQQNRMPLKRP